MASESGNQGAPSALNKLKNALGLPGGGFGGHAINTHPRDSHALGRQDSLPEICSTPSEVGIFEVAHNTCRDANGKFSWKKFFFEAPGSASPHSGSGVAGAPGAGAVTGAAAAAAATPPSAAGQ